MTDCINKKIDLLDLSLQELKNEFSAFPKYTAGQLFVFLHEGKTFDDMTSLKKDFREELKQKYTANSVEILKTFCGKSGTKKYLFKLSDGNLIEGVFMPHDYGNTLCLSTQIGCRMNCSFCASGLDGLLRNLTAGEMLGQVVAVNKNEGGSIKNRKVTNLVLMGSGEPFDNYNNVLKFLEFVTFENGINISERNISLSTSGLCDKIDEFASSGHKVTLSISLHAPFDNLRSKLMPINKKYPIDRLVKSAKNYFEKTGRRVIFEYTLIKGENDSDACADELKRLTSGFPTHINLIRLNEVKENNYFAPTEDATAKFAEKLEKLGVSVTIRRSLGNDIEGACGQLRRRYLEENLKK